MFHHQRAVAPNCMCLQSDKYQGKYIRAYVSCIYIIYSQPFAVRYWTLPVAYMNISNDYFMDKKILNLQIHFTYSKNVIFLVFSLK